MSNFWPSGFNINDSASPLEILLLADKDWRQESKNLVSLLIQENQTSSKFQVMTVHAQHLLTNQTVTLFSVAHRPSAPYPVVIQPKNDELPEYLRKSVYKPGFADARIGFSALEGKTVTNEWVCDTPSEFRVKLQKVFNLGTVKADLLSLVTRGKPIDEKEQDFEEK